MHSLTCNRGNMASAVPYIFQMMGYPSLIYSTGHQFLMHLLEKSQKYSNLLLLINSFRKTKRHKYSQIRSLFNNENYMHLLANNNSCGLGLDDEVGKNENWIKAIYKQKQRDALSLEQLELTILLIWNVELYFNNWFFSTCKI